MKSRNQTSRIIIHHSASDDVSADEIRVWHLRRGWSDIGYHYVIRENGNIEKGRDVHVVGSHAKGRNTDSIGICITGHDDFTMEQYASLARLIKSLRVTYGEDLPLESHHDKCPGNGFSYDILTSLGV